MKKFIKNIVNRIKHNNKILWASINTTIEIERKLLELEQNEKINIYF